MNRRPTLLLIISCLLLSAVCYSVISVLPRDAYPNGWERVVLLVLLVCNLATIPPALLTRGDGRAGSGVSTALLATVWRLLTFTAALTLWTATKWPPGEFAAKCLVGCYFPFLVLESGLSIRKTTG